MCHDKFVLEPIGFRQVHILRLDRKNFDLYLEAKLIERYGGNK